MSKCTVLDEQCTEAETENRPQHWGYVQPKQTNIFILFHLFVRWGITLHLNIWCHIHAMMPACRSGTLTETFHFLLHLLNCTIVHKLQDGDSPGNQGKDCEKCFDDKSMVNSWKTVKVRDKSVKILIVLQMSWKMLIFSHFMSMFCQRIGVV